ncbi:MAG: SDR family NAD(P)-dependent oxidoreductase, partial [Planctomycetota bacterium]
MKPPFHAVITGASGGIGRAVSVHLARQYDARLLLVYHQNLTAAESCRDEIRTIGGDAETLCCDLADPKQQPALVARAFEKLDRIDAWIHLAGIDVLTGDAAKWDFETK